MRKADRPNQRLRAPSNLWAKAWEKVSLWIAPDLLSNDETSSKARLLVKILLAMLAANLIGLVTALLEPKNSIIVTSSFYGLVFLVLFLFLFLLRKGKILLAGWSVIIFLWTIVAFALLFFGGLHSQVPVVFGVVIMFMGSFLGGRAAVILALVTIGFLGLVAFFESANLMPPQLTPDYSPVNAWGALCVTFLLMSVLLHNSLASIKESEVRYQLAVRGSAAGLWDWNMLTNEVYYAPGFTEMLGYSKNEFPYDFSPFTDAIHPDDVAFVRAARDKHLMSAENKYDVEFRLRTKNGEYKWFHLKGEAVRDIRGKPYRMVGSIVDITKRKFAEESIVLSNEELLKANAELDRFVYSASHDLRAPISSLLGLIKVARLENDPTALSRLLDMQERSLLKLDKFIYDIVSYSRNNRVGVEVEKIDFNTLLDDTYDQLHHMEQFNQIKIIKEIDDNISFCSDKRRISIILNNLISNAIKYSNILAGDSFIKTIIRKTGTGISIHVIDNGEGIDQEYISKIFDMFYRASERSVGSGIGLYIVKEVVQKLNGTVEVTSKKYKGTEFVVRLPDLRNV